MTKQEFLMQLRRGLSGLPQDELEERLAFYREMIEDRMEDGLPEAKAVIEIGNVEEIAAQIIAEIPLSKLLKEKIRPKRKRSVWEIIFLVLGSPIWLSLLIAAVTAFFSVYAATWAVIVSLWAIELALGACTFCAAAAGIVLICQGRVLTGVAVLGAGFVCAGAAVFLFLGCRAVTGGILLLTRKIAAGIKKRLARKESVS